LSGSGDCANIWLCLTPSATDGELRSDCRLGAGIILFLKGHEVDEMYRNIKNKRHIKVLIIEDNDDHAELLCHFLSKAEDIYFDTERAELISSGIDFLRKMHFDVVISDLGLPDSLGVETFLKLHTLFPEIPVIVLTGLDDQETALKAVQGGAQDYLVKGKIDTNLLIRSIQYSIERQKLITRLESSLKEIKTLRGLLPMCAWCRKIRDDKGYWQELESYIRQHTDAAFTHGICPDCMKKVDPELYNRVRREKTDMRGQKGKESNK
jgi:CheY-like chemotaxis protein